MNIILLLIPISLGLLALGTWAFFWAVNHSQFDDLDTPALSPLADDVVLAQDDIDAHDREYDELNPEDAESDSLEMDNFAQKHAEQEAELFDDEYRG